MRRRSPKPPLPNATLLKAATSPFQADVWKIDRAGIPIVWKTFREWRWGVRSTIGRILTRREARNLRLLEGMENVPRLLATPEPWTLEMTCLAAEPIAETKTGHGLTGDYFLSLQQMVEEMHRRGLNHGDLRRKNLLWDPASREPCLVDFTQCLYSPKRGSLYDRIVHRRAREVDHLTLLKLRRWYLGDESLEPEELERLGSPPTHLKAGRFLRKKFYRPVKHWVRGKKRSRS